MCHDSAIFKCYLLYGHCFLMFVPGWGSSFEHCFWRFHPGNPLTNGPCFKATRVSVESSFCVFIKISLEVVDTWKQMLGKGCLEAAAWKGMLGSGCLEADAWRPIFGSNSWIERWFEQILAQTHPYLTFRPGPEGKEVTPVGRKLQLEPHFFLHTWYNKELHLFKCERCFSSSLTILKNIIQKEAT